MACCSNTRPRSKPSGFTTPNLSVYFCSVSVEKLPEITGCSDGGSMDITGTEGYISRALSTAESGRGSPECPWILSALPGQRINITMIDFQPRDSSTCHYLGHMKDLHTNQDKRICKSSTRERHLYVSTGTEIQVQLKTLASDESEDFLLYYKGKSGKTNRCVYYMH